MVIGTIRPPVSQLSRFFVIMNSLPSGSTHMARWSSSSPDFVERAGEFAAAGEEECDAFAEIIDLKPEASPGAIALAVAVETDGGASDDDFAPDVAPPPTRGNAR